MNNVSAPANQADSVLAGHAAEIRRLHKRVSDDVIEIGRLLTECKRICGHGNWLPWLEREFEWTDDTALNFMRVYELSRKSQNFRDLSLPISALYLLAAPSTPETARAECFKRAQSGEIISFSKAKRIVDVEKGRDQPKLGGDTVTRTSPAKRRSTREVRLEAFFDSLSFVLSACTTIREIEIPQLDEGRQSEALAHVQESITALTALRRRLKGAAE